MKKVIFLAIAVMILMLSGTIHAYVWQVEIVDPNLRIQHRHYLSFALDELDQPHIAYYIGRSNHQPPSTIRYAFWNGTSWEISLVDESYVTYVVAEVVSLAIDSNGCPHMCYTGDDIDHSYCLKYAYRTGTNWNIQTIDSVSGRVGEFCSLELDKMDRPHISYFDRYDFCLKHAYWNGTSWVIEVVANELAWGTSLKLDTYDNPCIAYYGDGHNLKYTYWNGSSWNFRTVEYFGGNVGSIDISLVLDSLNNPHITYHKFDNTLRYTKWDGSNWVMTTIATNYAGGFNWLTLDSQDKPRIAYYQALGTNWNVWYAYYDSLGWHNEPVSPSLGGGWYCRIALDSLEHPRIAYYNQNLKDIMYAKPIIPVGIKGGEITSIDNTILINNYPNPFNPRTTFFYCLPKSTEITLNIYNIKGQLIETLVNEFQQAGNHSVVWNAENMSAGIYFYRITTEGNISKTKKCVILK